MELMPVKLECKHLIAQSNWTEEMIASSLGASIVVNDYAVAIEPEVDEPITME